MSIVLTAQKIEEYGVLPIVKLENIHHAKFLAKAFQKAGMAVAEVVFRTSGADKVIAGMKDAYPEMAIGAGTILTTRQIDTAILAGAEFMLSPGTDAELIDDCLQKDVLPIPGCATASDVQLCVKHGISLVKLFPAGLLGGTDVINALSAPFPGIKFIPTNGVGFRTLSDYAANKHVAACAGIYPCTDDLIISENWDEISRQCEKALEIVAAVRK